MDYILAVRVGHSSSAVQNLFLRKPANRNLLCEALKL